MLAVKFAPREHQNLRILCIGAHSDDIEIGCGGTILRLLQENPGAQVHWIVLAASGQRASEAIHSANVFLAKAGKTVVDVKGFRDGFLPYCGAELKQVFEVLKGEVTPDVILTHYRNDLHQDHRLVSELTWNTFRNHLILEYEIVKYDGDIGNPNFFVQLPEATCREKVRNLIECFKSQQDKSWFTVDTFMAILRLRGLESNAPEKYSEAFYCRKACY